MSSCSLTWPLRVQVEPSVRAGAGGVLALACGGRKDKQSAKERISSGRESRSAVLAFGQEFTLVPGTTPSCHL